MTFRQARRQDLPAASYFLFQGPTSPPFGTNYRSRLNGAALYCGSDNHRQPCDDEALFQ